MNICNFMFFAVILGKQKYLQINYEFFALQITNTKTARIFWAVFDNLHVRHLNST